MLESYNILLNNRKKSLEITDKILFSTPFNMGSIYFISDGMYTKIGLSKKNALFRINEIQVGNPNPLVFLRIIKFKKADYICTTLADIEKYLHRYFGKYHSPANNEWFILSEEQIYSDIIYETKYDCNIFRGENIIDYIDSEYLYNKKIYNSKVDDRKIWKLLNGPSLKDWEKAV